MGRRSARRRRSLTSRRLAGLQWTLRARQVHTPNSIARPPLHDAVLGGAVVDRRPGRRAEPVAAHQDGDLHRSRRSGRAWRCEDPELWKHPWIYFVEPATSSSPNRSADAARVPAARRHRDVRRLSRARTSGRIWSAQLKRVFPDRRDRRGRSRRIRSTRASTSSRSIRRFPGSARS